MVQAIPNPDPRELLPPLLACLPTAFSSPRPPPALLPLLTPILRQRVQLLSARSSNSVSWLPLLSWDRQVASKLPATAERIQIEPHPVSGEVEFDDVHEVEYRRLDSETLHCRLHVEEFNLLPIYLWCMGDGQGGGSGWRLAELRTLEDKDDGSEWQGSMQDTDQSISHGRQLGSQRNPSSKNGTNGERQDAEAELDDDDDDGAYWAAYDRSPGRTPAKHSPAPAANGSNPSVQPPTTSELAYFARYMAEVQPAMDPDDPSQQDTAPGESTLNGNTFTAGIREVHQDPNETTISGPSGRDSPISSQQPVFSGAGFVRPIDADETILHPRPSSSSSSLSGSVDRLEREAASHSRAEVGIKQHISTDIKSLYRLARSAGIDRIEFERIVKTELEVLSMMDME